MTSARRIYVARSASMVGSALVREFRQSGYEVLVASGGKETPSEARALLERERPECAVVLSGESFGIESNLRFPADIMAANLLFEAPTLLAAHEMGVERLVYVCASCVYPRDCPQPMQPKSLLTGPFEPSNEAYSVAKLASLTLCRALRRQYGRRYVTVIPATPFGPGDHFDGSGSHVVTGLIHRMHEARILDQEAVSIWGTGSPRRDFLFVDDVADACRFILERYDGEELVNVAAGPDLSIRELADLIRETVGFGGRLEYDTSRPDGAPCKVLDTRILKALGWQPRRDLRSGLAATYEAYLQSREHQEAQHP